MGTFFFFYLKNKNIKSPYNIPPEAQRPQIDLKIFYLYPFRAKIIAVDAKLFVRTTSNLCALA